MQRNLPKKVVEIVKRLCELLRRKGIEVRAAYLFGSYAKGTQLKRSDIDLVIISDSWKNLPFTKRMDLINEIIWKERLGNIEVIPVTAEEFSRKDSVVLRDASKYWIKII